MKAIVLKKVTGFLPNIKKEDISTGCDGSQAAGYAAKITGYDRRHNSEDTAE